MSESIDRNLLFGVLALQHDFVSREQLIAAVTFWLADKSRPLHTILREQQALAEDECVLLSALLAKQLEKHNGHMERSLAAALVRAGSLSTDLQQLGDDGVNASLAHVSAPPERDDFRHAETGGG